MKDFRSTVLESATKQLAAIAPYIWLVEVLVPQDPPVRIRITNFTEPVTRGSDNTGHPIVYYPFPVAQGDLLQQTHGDLTDITFNVANITLEIASLLDQYDGLTGQPVVIRLVNLDGISDTDAELRTDGKVVSCHVTDTIATFTVSATNLTKALFPKRRCLATCIWRFGAEECGYDIPVGAGNTVGTGFDFCNHELEDCETRGEDEEARGRTVKHPLRFGGMPGMLSGART